MGVQTRLTESNSPRYTVGTFFVTNVQGTERSRTGCWTKKIRKSGNKAQRKQVICVCVNKTSDHGIGDQKEQRT